MEDGPLHDPNVRAQYKQMLATGVYIEAVYHCNDCGHGGTAIVHMAMARELMCSECGSSDVLRSMLSF